MTDQTTVLTLRISEALLNRLQEVARHLSGARRSRSDAARYALESGLERLEEEFGIQARIGEAPPQDGDLLAQISEMQRRMDRLERQFRMLQRAVRAEPQDTDT